MKNYVSTNAAIEKGSAAIHKLTNVKEIEIIPLNLSINYNYLWLNHNSKYCYQDYLRILLCFWPYQCRND